MAHGPSCSWNVEPQFLGQESNLCSCIARQILNPWTTREVPLAVISNLMALCSEKMLDMISVFLNLLRFTLWPSVLSVLENVPCALEKNVYSVAFGWEFLQIFNKSIYSNMSFKFSVSLLIFLSIDVSGC